QGLLPALATSRHLNIPVVFAYASVPNAWGSRETISATIQERAHFVLKDAISAEDRVIIIDDIVRTGSTVQALKSICEQAGATFVGVGAIIHNRLLENCMNGFQMETLAQVSPSSSSSQPVTISPAVDDLALPEVVAADVLTERVMTDGVVLPGNLLKVYSFINHQVDTGLMDMCGQLLARVFAGFGIQKVLTAQTGGLPPAHAVATALRVPLVCARETHENDQSVMETMYSAPSESFTKKKKLVLYVTKESLCSNDTVLVVDDFLATGTTGVALHRLAEQAGAQVAGMAFLVEKRFQDGRGAFCHPKNHMHHEQYRRKALCNREPPPADGGGVAAASVLAKRFVDAKCSAVLTAEMSGVAPAMALARKLRVPLVCARRELSKVMVVSGGTVSAKVEGSTDSARGMLHIFKDHLRRDDTVLVVDDILGNGATALAMQELCEQVGATVVGMGFLVEKVFQHGRGKILARRPQLEDGIVALTKILSMDDKGLKIFRCPEPHRDTWLRVASDLVRRMSAEVEIDVAANAMKFRSVLGLHMSMDPVLLDACGDVLAAQFAGVTKVLTGAPVQGLSVAYVVARHCEVPMIFARTGVPLTMKGQRILSAQAPTGTFNVSAEFFGPSDRVLIVDDFLASGQTAKALQQICTEAGVQIAGFAFLALNKTQLVGQRSVSNGNGATGKEALGFGKVVVLAEVFGGIKQGRCDVKVADWLQRMS
ncbi:Xanthine phosphoribosyltransferase (XPRTase), partial [Durusdinium trenchii]